MPIITKPRPRVVHCLEEPYDVYVGRPNSKVPRERWGLWGNPYKIGVHGDRPTTIRMFRAYLLGNKVLLDKLWELQGKTLGCWCAPHACHADCLLELANRFDARYQV